MKSTKKKKIEYGNVEVPDDAFEPKNAKFRVTMFLDLDLLDELRSRASQDGLPYQTYINRLLRQTVLGTEEETRIRKIVQEELEKRSA